MSSHNQYSNSLSRSQLAYRNFIDTCRTPATRLMYDKALRYFMPYLRLPPDGYDRLIDVDHKIIQTNIVEYVSYLKKSGVIAPRSIAVYLAAIRKFYSMNDIQLNWEKIHCYQGDSEKQTEDRPYTHSEIGTMLSHTSPRNKAIILVMASGGLRVGAIETLRKCDLEPLDKYNIYKINVYANSRKSKYFTFCTPECRKEIDNYLAWRERAGERLSEDTPLLRKEYNSNNNKKTQALKTGAIRWLIASLLKDTGLRPVIPLIENNNIKQPHYRSHIMECHGLRKFFETNSFKAGMNNIYIRRLMGQKSGLEDSYLKLSEEELLEGDSKHVGFIGIIDQLTINEENRLKRKVKTLERDVTRFDHMQAQIQELNKKLGFA